MTKTRQSLPPERRRANPLGAPERRRAIMAATERLLVERGKDVSTREIAEAAGIAEGTIFRVFATKDAIIDAIFVDAFDDTAARESLRRECAGMAFDECLLAIVTSLQTRMRRVLALIAAVGFRDPPDESEMLEQRRLGYAATAELLAPHADALRVDPDRAARVLHGLALAMTHPMLIDTPVTDPAAIVDLVLRGIGRTGGKS